MQWMVILMIVCMTNNYNGKKEHIRTLTPKAIPKKHTKFYLEDIKKAFREVSQMSRFMKNFLEIVQKR